MMRIMIHHHHHQPTEDHAGHRPSPLNATTNYCQSNCQIVMPVMLLQYDSCNFYINAQVKVM